VRRNRKAKRVPLHGPEGDPFLRALSQLPLFSDLYLYMQATNLAVINRYLEDLEDQMVARYFLNDTASEPITTIVSALSQLWIFGFYELLRTWKQWASELIDYAHELAKFDSESNGRKLKEEFIQQKMKRLKETVAPDNPAYCESFEQVEREREFSTELDKARNVVLPLFRRVEALRVTLAKHEVPKGKGVRAFAPGYARIDSLNNCLCWFVQMPSGSLDLISRRSIAEECCALLAARARAKAKPKTTGQSGFGTVTKL
jgi:hypothetical protein